MEQKKKTVGSLGTRGRDKARITAANRDALRKRCFALHADGLTYEDIATRLGIGSKNTVMKYVHQMLPRRRYDPRSKEILGRIIYSLERQQETFLSRFIAIEGDGVSAANARVKWAAVLERVEKQLLYLHGIELPETDPEAILEERGRKMNQAARELSEPVGYPELSEQAIVDRHVGEESDEEFIKRIKQQKEDWEQARVEEFEQKELERERLRMLERHHQEELEKLKRRGINLEDLDSDDDGDEYRFTSWEETLDSAESY